METPLPTSKPTVAEKLSGGHQEVGKILDEVEQIYLSQPTQYLLLHPIANMLQHLWYEDTDEFEDAVGGSFEDFMKAMPHVELRKDKQGRTEFKIRPPDPDAPPTVMTLQVKTRADLWRVLFKSPDAIVRIPHIEFEIGIEQKRCIDSLYNHISQAAWNLASHVRGRTDVSSDYVARVGETIDALNKLLDVDEPFTIIVDDHTGVSCFKPDDGVHVRTLAAVGDPSYVDDEIADAD